MILYRYLHAHCLDTLRDKRFRLSNASRFNDSFDFSAGVIGSISPAVALNSILRRAEKLVKKTWGLELTDEQLQDFLKDRLKDTKLLECVVNRYNAFFKDVFEQREVVAANYKLLCFSRGELPVETDVKMWDLYADGGSGVRLCLECNDGYDARMHTLVPINYSDERLNIDLSKLSTLQADRLFSELMEKLPFTKQIRWSYEQEIRLSCLDQDVECEGDSFYWHFDPSLLKRVDIGAHVRKRERDAIISLVREKFEGVKVYVVVNDSHTYSIVYKQVN